MTTETKERLRNLKEEINQLRNDIYSDPADYDSEVIACLREAFRWTDNALNMV